MNSEKTVLVGYDGSESSRFALRWALDDARRRHLPVVILHADTPDVVLNSVGMGFYQPVTDPPGPEGTSTLAEATALAAEWAPGVTVRQRVTASSPAVAVLDAMSDAALVVLGSRGLDGFAELLVGSTSLHVATHATVPVVVVRARDTVHTGPEAGRIVVGVDGSDAAQDALAFGFEEAALRGVGVTAVRAWYSDFFDSSGPKSGAIPLSVETEVVVPAETAALTEAVAGWRNKYPDIDVREHVVHGIAAPVLVDAARGAELLVVGSRGRGGFRSLLLGSVSHAVMHHATAPVAVVRPFSTV